LTTVHAMKRPALFAAGISLLGAVVFTLPSAPAGAAGSFEPVKVVVGDHHSCALDSSGRVQCWGGLKYYSALPDSDKPRAVRLGRPAVDIAAGFTHTCAVLDDKTVKCWGDNRRKQFGIAGKLTKSPSPRQVSGLKNAISIVAGGYRSCALLEDTTIRCWGDTTSKATNVRRKRATLSGTLTDRLAGAASIGMSLTGSLTVRDVGGNVLCDRSRECGNVPGAVPATKEDGGSTAPVVYRSAMRGVPLGSASCVLFSGGLGCWPQVLVGSLESLRTQQGPDVKGCYVIDPEYLGPSPMLLAPGKFSSSCDDPSRDYEANKSRFEAFADPRGTAEARLAQIEAWVSTEVKTTFKSPFADVVKDVRDGSGSEVTGCIVTGDALQLRCWGSKLQQRRASTKTFDVAHPDMADVRDVAVGFDRVCVVRGGGTPGSAVGNTVQCWGWNESGQSAASRTKIVRSPAKVVFAG
jgi:hypothetical protein